MANDEVLGPRKTMFVLVIVVGCFAVLWPRILSPLILGHTQDQLKPNKFDREAAVKQERPLRGMAPHPALQERGRAIPPGVPPAGRQQMPPHVRVRSPLSVYLEVEVSGDLCDGLAEWQPPPIPGMRPPLGSAGGPVAAPKSSMGFVMPIYTICIIVFFVYTLSKILFKRTGTPYDPVIPDPQFRRRVFRDDSRTTPDKLVVTAISGLVAEVQQQMEASQQRQESPDNHARPYTNGTILLNTGPVQIVTSEYQEPKDQSPVLTKTKENLSERKESSPETKESSDPYDPILDIHSTQTKELTPILEENSQTKETSETKEIKNQNDTHPIPKDIEDVDVSSLEQTQSSIEQEESSITHKEHTPEPILPQPKQKDSSPELKQESEEQPQLPSASSIEHKEHFSEIKRSVTEQDHISSDQILDSEEKEISLDACVQEELHSELSLKQKESSLEQEESLNEHDDVFPDSLSSEHHTSPNLKEASIEQASPLLHKQISPESSLKEKELSPEPKELSVEPSVELKDTDSDEELPTDPNEPLPIQKESPPVQESSLQPKATLFEEETCPEPKETFIEKVIIPDPNASFTIQKESPAQQALFHPKESSEEQIVSVERETLEPDEGMQSRSKPEHESSIMQDEVASQRNDTADQTLVKEHTPEPTEEELIDISGIEDKIKTTEINSKTVTKINDKVDDEEILKKPGNIHVKRDTIDKTEEFFKEERDTATKDGPTTPELLAEALKEDSPEGNDNESSSVKVVGMEVTAHPADGSAWPGPPPLAAHPPATNTHKAEDVKSIFLETEIPQQSRVLVADFQDRADAQRAAKNAPLVVSGKMTLSLIQDAPRDTPERDPESTMDEFTTASAMTQPAEKDDDLSDEELEEEIDVEEIEEELEELEEEEEEEEEEEIELGANKTGSKSDKK